MGCYRVTKYRGTSAWEVDIRLRLPDGKLFRERVKSPVSSKSGTVRWAENRVAELIKNGRKPKKEVPTLEVFAPKFITSYSVANRLKHSTIVTQQSIIDTHLIPLLGRKKMDEIKNEEVQMLRGKRAHLNAKTVNNIVGVLSRMVRVAVDWGVIETVPFKVKPLKSMLTEMRFYDDHEFERLVTAAEKLGASHLVITLLGGEAGLRAGEILSLEFPDIDFGRGSIHVQRSTWCGVVGTPKGGRSRRVSMTARLAAVLKASRHLNGKRVLQVPADEANMKSLKFVRSRMKSVQRLAGLDDTGNVHILRHYAERRIMPTAPVRERDAVRSVSA